jgi:hypothetical protein
MRTIVTLRRKRAQRETKREFYPRPWVLGTETPIVIGRHIPGRISRPIWNYVVLPQKKENKAMTKVQDERVFDKNEPKVQGTILTRGPDVSEVEWDEPSPWGKRSNTPNEHLEAVGTNGSAPAEEATTPESELPAAPQSDKATARASKSKGVKKAQMKKTTKKIATKKVAAKKKIAAPKKLAVAAKKTNGERRARGDGQRLVAKVLCGKRGATKDDVLKATGWKALNIPATAKKLGLKLRVEREARGAGDRTVNVYYGTAKA